MKNQIYQTKHTNGYVITEYDDGSWATIELDEDELGEDESAEDLIKEFLDWKVLKSD